MAITLRVGDTRFGFVIELANEAGQPINLTGATAVFYAEDRSTGAIIVNQPMYITDAVNGQAMMRLESADISTAALVDAEIVVTYPDGKIETFPNRGKIQYEIVTNLRQ